MTFENILIEESSAVAEVTINRPSKLNALNKDTIRELSHYLDAANKNPDIRVIILTGAGEKAFVAGADIAEFAAFSVKQGKMLSAEGHQLLFDRIEHMSKPVIAAINGFSLGGGLELAMSCHIRVASENAKMGLPEVSLGLIPGYGGTQRLAQLVGKGRALEMITTAGMITAEAALQMGLVNHVTSAGSLMEKCREIAGKIAANSPAAIAAAIQAVNAGFSRQGFDAEIEQFGTCFGTADFKEGTSAFLEKRKANFTGK